jgi:signal transduction histidine kinase
MERALDEVLTAAIELVRADAGYIRLFDTPGDLMSYPFAAQRGFSPEYIDYFGSLARPLDPNARPALARGERVIVEDMTSHPAFQPHLSYVLTEGYISMQATPMVTRAGKSVGAIITAFIRCYTPPEEELELLSVYADLAAGIIERQERIESQERTERVLRAALNVKDEFLGLVSHELRTPLTVIRGMTSILNRNPDLARDKRKEIYEDLTNEGARLHRIIENMLALAKMQSGNGPAVEPINVNHFLESCAKAFDKELPGLQLEYSGLPGEQMVLGVERHVEQLLHNLVENAYKYSTRGSPIEIRAIPTPDEVLISVADRGIGVSNPESIFKPFRREHEAERVAGGLGLGLAVCKMLVESQGGRIWAEPRDGGGSVFTFTLPLPPEAAA